jgi:hypothetical protein
MTVGVMSPARRIGTLNGKLCSTDARLEDAGIGWGKFEFKESEEDDGEDDGGFCDKYDTVRRCILCWFLIVSKVGMVGIRQDSLVDAFTKGVQRMVTVIRTEMMTEILGDRNRVFGCTEDIVTDT